MTIAVIVGDQREASISHSFHNYNAENNNNSNNEKLYFLKLLARSFQFDTDDGRSQIDTWIPLRNNNEMQNETLDRFI